jgi:hypothetical protein
MLNITKKCGEEKNNNTTVTGTVQPLFGEGMPLLTI